MKLNLVYIFMVLMLTACSYSADNQYLSYEDYPVYKGELREMVYSPSYTNFMAWAPTADEVKVLIYEKESGGAACRMESMTKESDGVWIARIDGDMKGMYYTFNAKIEGVWRGDSPGFMPNAVSVDGNRAAIIAKKDISPEGWENDVRPKVKSALENVIYGLNLSKYTLDTIGRFRTRAKYLSLVQDSTYTYHGMATGIAHLKEMGVTHVNLQSVYEHSSVKPYAKSGIKPVSYNIARSFNVPSGSLSTNGILPQVRVKELKQLVQAMHSNGIRVMMDVDYSRMASGNNSFEKLVPGYFSSQDKKGSSLLPFNYTRLDREMVRRFVVQSLSRWVKDYHIDGFRIRNIGEYNKKLLDEIYSALAEIDTNILLVGVDDAHYDERKTHEDLLGMDEAAANTYISIFDNAFAQALRGDSVKKNNIGFISGNRKVLRELYYGITAGAILEQEKYMGSDSLKKDSVFWTVGKRIVSPKHYIANVGQDADMTLADRLLTALPRMSDKELNKMMKLYATLAFTSQGIPYINAGDEVINGVKVHSKKYPYTNMGNVMDWRLKKVNEDYYNYVISLLDMRRKHPAFRMTDAEMISKHMQILEVPKSNVVAYMLHGKANGDIWRDIIVIVNGDVRPSKVKIPKGDYRVVCRGGSINMQGLELLSGSKIEVEPRSAAILVR